MAISTFPPRPRKRRTPSVTEYHAVYTDNELHHLLDVLLARGGHDVVEAHFRAWLGIEDDDDGLPSETARLWH